MGGLSARYICSILKSIVKLTVHPQDSFFCTAYLTFKSGIDHEYVSMLVSLLLTKPQYCKIKEERGIQRGTQPEKDNSVTTKQNLLPVAYYPRKSLAILKSLKNQKIHNDLYKEA